MKAAQEKVFEPIWTAGASRHENAPEKWENALLTRDRIAAASLGDRPCQPFAPQVQELPENRLGAAMMTEGFRISVRSQAPKC